jgi:PIN domain nuclease of toxin-antitoxin system
VGRNEVIVLDTNVLIWAIARRSKLSKPAESVLRRQQDVRIPSICFWEFAMQVTRGKVSLNGGTFEDVIAAFLAGERVAIEPISPAIGLRASRLSQVRPMDPGDQLIAATAMELDVPLVTSDERLHSIPGLKTIW